MTNKFQVKQGVQGLHAFGFCVVTINYKHTKSRFKIKLRD